jgi:branched-chain amino acid transport system ATP-binding protein
LAADGLLLSVQSLEAGYGGVRILQGISFDVADGELVAIVGPNGSGKTTALKAVMGLLEPSAGRVFFRGDDITGIRTDLLVRLGVGVVPQGRIVFPRMTVRENLRLGAFAERDRERVDEALETALTFFPELRQRIGQRAGTLSGGEQQMVAIGRALMSRPQLLLMDEPSLGLSPRYVALVFERVVALRAAGLSILMVEQNATRALRSADRAYVFETGRVRHSGRGGELLQNDEVRSLYLGVH